MKHPQLPPLILAALLVAGTSVYADTPAPKKASAELNDARHDGWKIAALIVDRIKDGDLKKFPGIAAWLQDFDKVAKTIDLKVAADQWPAIDVDALTTRNANFWQAYYEIAPADPGLILLQAGMLLGAGEAARASYLIVLMNQRPGMPKDVRRMLSTLLAHADKGAEKSNRLVRDGIELHDKKDYPGAIKKYDEALAELPQNGFAHFEMGYTLYHQQLLAAGAKPPAPGSVNVNKGTVFSEPVKAAYARSRLHDPFQIHAYQGGDKEVIQGFMALAKDGMPAWEKLLKAGKGQVDDDVIGKLGAACQEAGSHELALAARSVLVARRGGFAPVDHPFITTSLNKSAPGKQTDAVLKRLAGGELQLRQLIAPEKE